MSLPDEPDRLPNGVLPAPIASPVEVVRWQRVKAVFLGALETEPAMRTDYVATACGDDADLRAEVLSLLECEQAAASFGETPAAGLLTQTLTPETPKPRLESGTRLGGYEIVAFVSAGGMGEVYRARHTVLHREVAIKMVGAQISDPVAQRRLIREARHASTLDHPNICAIYEVGETDGQPFMVMQFIDGRPLHTIVRAQPLALDAALAIGLQVADALEHAHRHGIVHRDLKSSNVVLDGNGKAMVLDFGLAKRVIEAPADESQHSTITSTGTVAGTLSHMAPEVLLGRAADARSDVWSLGVLLYELVTGELPFRGRTSFEISSAILGDAPRPIAGKTPLAYRLAVERCLMKNPAARYQCAADVRDALDAIRRRHAWPLLGRLLVSTRRRMVVGLAILPLLGGSLALLANRLHSGAAGSRISRLALMPFQNASADSADAYYAAGIGDALLSQLGAVSDVRVIAAPYSRSRSLATDAHAARQLGVDALVTGRVRKIGDRIAVDVRLVEPARGRVLWSDTYERPIGQVLALQADVVRALAAEIRLTIRSDAQERLATVRAVNPEAYEEYLKGRYEWSRRTERSLDQAIAHFQRAIELDPTYAPAYAALADCYNQFGTLMVGTGSPRDYRPRAAAAAIHALQIDRNSAEAHATLGYVRHYDWQFAEAEREFMRAIALNPSYALAHIWYANLLMSRGRITEALEHVYTARDLDPFSLIVNANVGWILNAAGRYDDAIDHLIRTLQLDSTYAHAHWRLSGAYMGAGRYGEAYAAALKVVQLTDSASPALSLLAQVNARLGRTGEIRGILTTLIERSRKGYVPPAAVTDVYLSLGNIDSALVWLPRVFEERANYAVYMQLDSTAGPLQRDARFQALVASSGLRQ